MPSVKDLIARDELTALYQPIVDLSTGEPVAYEALLRGPEGSPLHLPGALFAAAREEGLSRRLEWEGFRCAVEGALRAGLGEGHTLFVNVEGGGLATPTSPPRQEVIARAAAGLRVVLEVTERELLASPAELQRAGEALGAQRWGLAIDDIGVDHPIGASALRLVQPDVVKLDMSLVTGRPDPATATIAMAVRAYAEEHGGSVVAEGIETEQDVHQARALGATLGQGYLFGRPGPLPRDPRSTDRPVRFLARPRDPAATSPWALSQGRMAFEPSTKRNLVQVSRQFEMLAESFAPDVIVLSAFQQRVHFTPRSAAIYEGLSRRCALVAAVAMGLDETPAGEVVGGTMTADDDLLGEWVVVVLSPHYGGALVARDLGDTDRPDMERRFSHAVTHDRALVAQLGIALMARLDGRATIMSPPG